MAMLEDNFYSIEPTGGQEPPPVDTTTAEKL